jgi:hypothetical protein
MNTTENNCPCCHNHCPKEQLKCPRGENYFSGSGQSEERHGRHRKFSRDVDISTLSTEEAIAALMGKCGHFLGHNKAVYSRAEGGNILTANLSADEKEQLKNLISKCAENVK